MWIDAEKPFWWDMPIWLASGKIDSIGLANNHMQRDGMLTNEAWGNRATAAASAIRTATVNGPRRFTTTS